MRNILQGVDIRRLEMDTWPTVDETLLDAEEREPFRRRKCAVIAVIRSNSVNLGAEESGLTPKEVRRVFKRCLKIHRDGRVTGFRACVRYHRIKNYELSDETTTGYAGLLGRLFRNYPSIEKALIRFATSRKNSEMTLPVRVSDLSFKLLELCREVGLAANEYPLAAVESARKALEGWYARLADSMGRGFIRAEFGEDAARQYDDGLEAYVSSVDPHRIMVFDEWTAHAFTAVEIPQPGGGTMWVPISRYKFINGVRRGDHVVCASRPVLRKEPDVAEFLATIEGAIRPHRRREFTVPGYAYPATPCFTSDTPGGEWLLPDLLYLDRSLVHLAAENRIAITRGLGSIILYGPPRRPRGRGDVEALNSFFATKVRKFPTTTGSGPKDPVRHEPEKEAVRLHFHHDLLAQFLEMLRVDYSTCGKKSLKGHTPMEVFQRWAGNSCTILRHLPPSHRDQFALAELCVPVTISCDQKSGRQPVVRYKYGEYVGPHLANMRSRNKEKCLLVLNRQAAHLGRLYSLREHEKHEIDVLHTRGEWKEPHTLRERELYYDFKVSRQQKPRDRTKSRTQQLREFCERQAAADKDMALVYADLSKPAAEGTADPLVEPHATQAKEVPESSEETWRKLNCLSEKITW